MSDGLPDRWSETCRRMADEIASNKKRRETPDRFKVSLPTDSGAETCWASRLSPRHAILLNAPALTAAASLYDVIEYQDREDNFPTFVRVVSPAGFGVRVVYASKRRHDKETTARRFRDLCDYVRGLSSTDDRLPAVEGTVPGAAVVAFPKSFDEAVALELVSACRVVMAADVVGDKS